MGTLASEVRSVAAATADLVLAVVGLAVLFSPAILVGNALLGSPLASGTVRLLVGVLALGGAYPFLAGHWSLDALGDYVLAFVVSVVAVGLLLAVVIATLGRDVSGSSPAPQALLFALAYGLAAVLVRLGGSETAMRAVAGP